jgi:hypothetical protein
MGETHVANEAIPAILDVRHNELHVPGKRVGRIRQFVKSEAAAFISIWNDLRRSA